MDQIKVLVKMGALSGGETNKRSGESNYKTEVYKDIFFLKILK